jgi:amino acid transporter
LNESRAKSASLFYLIFMMYSYTTGGPFGLEAQVSTAGPGMALLYFLVVPFFWCIPMSLVAAELTTAMPIEGGFYRWVRAAFGDFWGFLAGWWNWTAGFLLCSSYAVIFADYVAYYYRGITAWEHYFLSLGLIALIAFVNIRGIRMVGRLATALEIFAILPVIVLCLLALTKWRHNPFSPFIPSDRPPFQVFGVGLALALWAYSGYEQLSSVAEEVENPQRSYPRALSWVVPLSVATFFFPTLLSLAALGNWQDWKTGYFAEAASAIGGSWLGAWLALAAAVTSVAILNSTMLTSTRMPFVMAEDGYLPANLSRRDPRFGTPRVAILLSAIIYGLFAWQSLTQLISVYIWLRIGTSVLTFLAAWQLRRKKPELPRAFRVPWGQKGLCYVVGAPLAMSVVALLGSDRFGARWGPVTLLLGPVAYLVFRRRS